MMAKPTVPIMEPVTGTASATSNDTPGAAQQGGAKEQSDKRKPRYIGAIDQGTTSTRFIIFDNEGELVASHQTELRAIHTHSG
jgi:glycerol kinase